MINDIWLNLPVKNIEKSRAFFTEMGFTFNPNYGNNDHSLCLMVGEKKVAVMLFEETMFQGFSQNAIADTQKGTEILLSIGAPSREAVDELARRAASAGGHVFGQPTEIQGWMYGCGFADLDGHRWNVLFMSA